MGRFRRDEEIVVRGFSKLILTTGAGEASLVDPRNAAYKGILSLSP
jgi:hypothetical protein